MKPNFSPLARHTEEAGSQQYLEQQVLKRLGRQLTDFQIVVHGEGLILKGRCQTYYVKQLAQHAVMECTELPILANQIEVH